MRKAVAIGGGTGLPTVLRCLLDCGFETSAVVTMADDGGSTGVLRSQLGTLPPGDVRNCLVAMAADPESQLARLFQYRFEKGEGLKGHAVGNLILAALAEMGGSFSEAVEAAGHMLDVRGRVLPCTLTKVVLHATDVHGRFVSGQANIARSEGPVTRVTMEPVVPTAYPPALEAIREADVVIIGPGSLFTSIIPNFLVSGVVRAMRDSSATRIYICNVANQRGETEGMDAAAHVDALHAHGLAGVIDVAIVHEASGAPLSHTVPGVYHDHQGNQGPVIADADTHMKLESMGIRVIAADLVDPAAPLRHHPERLCKVLEEVL